MSVFYIKNIEILINFVNKGFIIINTEFSRYKYIYIEFFVHFNEYSYIIIKKDNFKMIINQYLMTFTFESIPISLNFVEELIEI